MTDPAADKGNPWRSFEAFFVRKLTILQIIANLAGAGIVTSYFMFFDASVEVQRVTNDLIVIGIMFVGLVLIATFILNHWQKDLMQFVQLKSHDQPADSNLNQRVQKKILNLPYVCSMTSLFNWFLAANIMTIYFSMSPGKGFWAGLILSGFRIFIGIIIT